MWWHCLLGKKFILKIDHSSLTSYFNQPTLNTRHAIWVVFLSEFHFKIKNLKGRENRVVDALSRKLHHIYEISISQAKTDFKNLIKEASVKDLEYQFLWQQAKFGNNKENQLGYKVDSREILRYGGRLYILNNGNLK